MKIPFSMLERSWSRNALATRSSSFRRTAVAFRWKSISPCGMKTVQDDKESHVVVAKMEKEHPWIEKEQAGISSAWQPGGC